jgi:predicted transcriptional regulator
MRKETIPKPTEAELEILGILWEHGPSTVRYVNDKLNEKKNVGYTTTLKMMQIMYEKKILKRDEKKRSHLYKTSLKEQETQKILLKNIMEKAFGGSAMKLVMQALGSHKASKQEIYQIRELLDKIERGEK